MQPFNIQCTTCRRSLRVTSPEAMGQILACPKCGSMVMVETPPGWSADEATSGATNSTPMLLSASTFVPPTPVKSSSVKGSTVTSSPTSAGASAPPSATPQTAVAPMDAVATSVENVLAQMTPPSVTPPSATPSSTIASKVAGKPQTSAKTSAWKDPPLQPATTQVAAKADVVSDVDVAAGAWPRWFLPGVGATIALGVVIFILRLLLQSSGDGAATVAATTSNQAAHNSTVASVEPLMETPAPANADAGVADSTRNESAADGGDSAAAKPQADDPGVIADAPPPMEAAPVAAPSAQDVPPEPMPPPANELAKSDPMLPAAVLNDQAPAADTPPVPTMQRVPPRQVNLEARLADPIKSLDVRGMALHQFLDLLTELSTIPISLDLDALEQLNRSPSTPIAVKLKDTTVAEALEAALQPLGLGYDIQRGLVIVGRPQPETMHQVNYNVHDLVGDDAGALGELAAIVRQMIAPDSWQQSGGKASMAAGSGAIVVEQTPTVHHALLVFCEKLRVARGLPIKSRHDPAKFLLNTREVKAREMLQKPVTANFNAPQPLAGVLDWLERATKTTILVDHAALADAETSVESQCAALADGKPLAAMLDELLGPMELTWRPVEEGTIEITTPQAAADRGEIEFYPVRDLAADAAAGKALVEQVQVQLGPHAGNPELGIAIHFDAPSRALTVRAPQRMQSQIEKFLAAQQTGRLQSR